MAGLLNTNDQWLRSKLGLEPRVSGREQPSIYSDQAGFFNSINEGLLNMLPMGGMTVHHGSPHRFTKFDSSKIGTGEGAAAYGHGLYFAENPKVAREYQEGLSRPSVVIGGKTYKDDGTGYTLEGVLNSYGGNVDKALKRAEGMTKRYQKTIDKYGEKVDDNIKRQRDEWLGIHKELSKLSGKPMEYHRGNFYKVDLPDKHIEKMLDWDKPLDKQPAVMKVIKKHFKKAPKPFEDRYVDMNNRLFNPSDSTPHEFLSSFKSREQASQIMKDEGIPGIKYLDQNSRWRTPEQLANRKKTRNFVVFDDTLPKIEAINDVPIQGLMEGGKHSLLK